MAPKIKSPHGPQTSYQADIDRQQALSATAAEEHLENLQRLHLKVVTLQGDIDRQVAQLRFEGVTWSRIAAALQISPQAAHQRWSPDGTTKHRIRQRRLNGHDGGTTE